MTTGAAADGGGGGGGGGGGSGGSVGANVGSADAYRQSSSASPRGVVTGGGYCGSSASTPHSHSTNGSYSVANPYTGSPTLYTSRKSLTLSFSFSTPADDPMSVQCRCKIHKIQVVPEWNTTFHIEQLLQFVVRSIKTT